MSLSYSLKEEICGEINRPRSLASNSSFVVLCYRFFIPSFSVPSLLLFCLILVFIVLFCLLTGDVESLHHTPSFLTVMRNERATSRSLIHS